MIKNISKRMMRVAKWFPLVFAVFFVLVPLYWVFATALKNEADVLRRPTLYFPKPATFQNFSSVWGKSGFSIYFINTFFVSTVVALVVMALSILAAYSMSRYGFRGKKAFLLVLLITQMFPGAMLIVPLFLIFSNMNLISSLWSLVLSYTAINIPFNVILMKSFVDGIPYEIEEAAKVDGASQLGTIIHILLPLLTPGTAATGIFAFMNAWNEFIFPIMFINRQDRFVLSVGLMYMIGQNITYYGALAAGSIVAMIVPIILFGFSQKYFVRGLSSGAVKA